MTFDRVFEYDRNLQAPPEKERSILTILILTFRERSLSRGFGRPSARPPHTTIKTPVEAAGAELAAWVKAQLAVHGHTLGPANVVQVPCDCSACKPAGSVHGSGPAIKHLVCFIDDMGRFCPEISRVVCHSTQRHSEANGPRVLGPATRRAIPRFFPERLGAGQTDAHPPRSDVYPSRIAEDCMVCFGNGKTCRSGLNSSLGYEIEGQEVGGKGAWCKPADLAQGLTEHLPKRFFVKMASDANSPENKVLVLVAARVFSPDLLKPFLPELTSEAGVVLTNAGKLSQSQCVSLFGTIGYDPDNKVRVFLGDDGQERLVPTSLWYSDPTAPFRAAKSLAKTAFFKANDADSFPSEAAYKKAAEEEGLKAYAAAYAKAKAKLLLRAHDADAAISGDEDQE